MLARTGWITENCIRGRKKEANLNRIKGKFFERKEKRIKKKKWESNQDR